MRYDITSADEKELERAFEKNHDTATEEVLGFVKEHGPQSEEAITKVYRLSSRPKTGGLSANKFLRVMDNLAYLEKVR